MRWYDRLLCALAAISVGVYSAVILAFLAMAVVVLLPCCGLAVAVYTSVTGRLPWESPPEDTSASR